jgi:hypothetical protein
MSKTPNMNRLSHKKLQSPLMHRIENGMSASKIKQYSQIMDKTFFEGKFDKSS